MCERVGGLVSDSIVLRLVIRTIARMLVVRERTEVADRHSKAVAHDEVNEHETEYGDDDDDSDPARPRGPAFFTATSTSREVSMPLTVVAIASATQNTEVAFVCRATHAHNLSGPLVGVEIAALVIKALVHVRARVQRVILIVPVARIDAQCPKLTDDSARRALPARGRSVVTK